MHNKLEIRSWNGTRITRRTTDGYVNATAMCKANEKQWNDYYRTDRASLYLEALSSSTGNPVHELVQGRGGNGGGTWIHPQVAVDLSRWISAPFAVMMDGWLLDKTSVRQSSSPVLPDVLETVERSIGLLERLGGVDERAQMLLRDVVLNTAMKAAGGSVPELEPAKYLTLSEKLIELGCPSHKATDVATKIGKQIIDMYRRKNGREPKKQDQLVRGKRCAVASYEKDFLKSLEDDLKFYILEQSS